MYTKAISIQPSVIGYIAKSIALVCKGEKYDGYRACDIAFEHIDSSHISFLLLIKVRIVHTSAPTGCSCPSGYHRVHGQRTQ